MCASKPLFPSEGSSSLTVSSMGGERGRCERISVGKLAKAAESIADALIREEGRTRGFSPLDRLGTARTPSVVLVALYELVRGVGEGLEPVVNDVIENIVRLLDTEECRNIGIEEAQKLALLTLSKLSTKEVRVGR